MPQGFAVIGTMVLGALGSFGAAVATSSLATMAVGVATSAIVGAAIGGLSAAVTGGDIKTGMLIGAIGGVVAGGLAGGSLAATGGTSGSFLGSEALGYTGSQVTADAAMGGYAADLALGAAPEAATNFFGGAFASEIGMNTIGNKLMEKALDFTVAGLEPGEEIPYSQSQEYLDKKLATEERVSMAQINKGTPMPYQSTQAGFREQLAHDTSQLKLQGEQRLQEVDKTYKMQKENMLAEYDKAAEKYIKAADVASQQEFVGGSQETKDAILAAQQQKQQQGMLTPPQIGQGEASNEQTV